ncbi:MAG TPA: acyl-CoA dehydrogenase family protein [Candidatus Limnocylindrales bacterium]
MDFTLTESQAELAALARRILSGDRRHWKEFDAAGLLDPSLDLLERCSVLIEVGRAVSDIPYLATVFTPEEATVGVCAQQLGVIERALEMTAAYACDRVQFGRPIGSFQAVAQRLADAYIDVEAVRLTMWQAAWRLSRGLPSGTEIAVAKFWAADAGHRVAHTAVHVHGGVGIDLDSPVHRYFLMAKRLEFTLGHATESLLRITPP